MRADDFFALVDSRQVATSPYLSARYAVHIVPMTLEEAQRSADVWRQTPQTLCPACGEMGTVSTGHRVCGRCRMKRQRIRRGEAHAV